MPMKRAVGRLCAGMTLLEVLAATAILMATCAAATSVVVTAARAGSSAEKSARLDTALVNEAARLRALPYFTALTPEAFTEDDWSGSVVAELFPHADETILARAGTYEPAAGRGRFTTTDCLDNIQIARTAWFVSGGNDVEHALGMDALGGWRADRSILPPAGILLVRLSASVTGVGERALWCVLGSDAASRHVD
jgi:type II secretory pathway pseudopilin PulG